MRSPMRFLSHTPSAETTSSGYCANTGARKSWGATLGAALFMMLASSPTGRRCRETGGLGQVEHPVHPLHGAAGGAFVEIIHHAHDGDGTAVGHRREMRVIAGDDLFYAWRS